MTISRLIAEAGESLSDLTPGKAALRVWAIVCRGPSCDLDSVSVVEVVSADFRGRSMTLAPRPGRYVGSGPSATVIF